MDRSSVSTPSSSRATSITVIRVTPSRMLLDSEGVTSLPCLIMNRFSPEPSTAWPDGSSRMASSHPASVASVLASRLLTYRPLIFSRGGIIVSSILRHVEVTHRMTSVAR